MGSYYYLAAQLPFLVYGQGVPMSSDEFRALAKDKMSSADAVFLDFCVLGSSGEIAPDSSAASNSEPHGSSPFISHFRQWEKALKLNLARNRAQKLKREGVAIDAPDYPADAVAAAKNALAMESPLEAEIYLDRARWDAIESFQGISTFNENAMYAYLLKLLLMERRSAFKTEEGLTEYKALYAAILGEP